MTNIKFVSNLPQELYTLVKEDFTNRLEMNGYKPDAIEFSTTMLDDEYIHNLDDSIEYGLFQYIRDYQEGEENPKLYKRYDLQDETDYTYETLAQAKEWLADFWTVNPYDDETDEEHEAHIQRILATQTAKELDEMLQGIDFTIEEAF